MPTVLLCHCDGTNGSATFTDVSASAHSLTATTTTVSTTTPKFGTGCASLAASSSRLNASTGLTDFNFGSGQFTVEAWVYFTRTITGTQMVLSQWNTSQQCWAFTMNAGSLAFFYSTTGVDAPNVSAVYAPPATTWIHLAADRDASNVLRVYVNGAVLASATVSAAFFASVAPFMVGNDGTVSKGFPGNLDEIRIVKGTAMYGGAFTPPVAPFPDAPVTSTIGAMMLA